MSAKPPPPRELPAEILDDERSWHGDHDPYLAALAHSGRTQPPPPPPPPERAPRLEGPPDDGDVYLAQLTRGCGRDVEFDPETP
jgi:hypothetical protein